MKFYSPNDVSTILQIKPATLRKYSSLLEKYGYKIERNTQNHRYYQDKDIITLRNIVSGSNSGDTLEETIKNVVQLEMGSSKIGRASCRKRGMMIKVHDLVQRQE